MADATQSGNRTLRGWTARIWSILSKFVLMPLVGALIGAMLIGRIVDWFVGPDSYKVYVVGNFQPLDGTTTGASKILDGFKGMGELPAIGPKRVKVTYEAVNDHGDPADAQKISANLASRSDTLMVVGHFSSTQTKAALPAYLRSIRPPIPVIMTTETNPDLVPPKLRALQYDPVFRLSPTDDQQALRAADFAIHEHATAFWVVQDLSNPVYSDYLTSRFSERILEQSKDVITWGNNLSVPPIDAFTTLKIDWIFFPGPWQEAILLARQVRKIPGGDKIHILLGDACADENLIAKGGSDVEGIYITHQMQASDFNSPNAGYEVFGRNAFRIIEQIINSANDNYTARAAARGGMGYRIRGLLGLRRAVDSRNVIAAVMQEATSTATKRLFTLNSGGSYRFDEAGTPIDAKWHVWQVQGGKFVDVPADGPG